MCLQHIEGMLLLLMHVYIPGSEINFFKQAPTGDWNYFFQSPHGKMWSPKSVNKNFPSQRNTNQNFWSPYTEFRATSNCFKSFLHLLDVQTHYKQTQTFQYTNFYLCHPPVVKKGFIKGEALHLLRTNSSLDV